MGRIKFCCCGCSVRAGTLLLLFLDLICYGWVFVKAISSSMDSYGNSSTGVILILIVLLTTVVLGLFGIGQEKPMLLIPYLLHRIIWTSAITIALTMLIFVEGYAFNALSSSNALSDMSRFSDSVRSFKNGSQSFILVLLIVEILIIAIEVHFVRVVYSCYKEMEDSKTIPKGIISLSVQGQYPNLPHQISSFPHDNYNNGV